MPHSPQSQVGGGTAKVPMGTVVYQLGAGPCIGTGIQWTPEESRDALDGPVADLLNDVTGSQMFMEALGPLAQAEFDTERINAVAASGPEPRYRIGESIGVAYLSAWRDCTFPWLVSRDLRRSTASPAGPDLVGLKIEAGGHYLVFGEVKTSKQDAHPPSVMRGRSGLLRQLEDLRADRKLQRFLIRNLLFRCDGHLHERFIAAVSRHTADPDDCRFFGVLVRDVLPDKRDLRHAVSRLGHNCPEVTKIEVIAIYLPPGHLDPVASDSTFDGGTP